MPFRWDRSGFCWPIVLVSTLLFSASPAAVSGQDASVTETIENVASFEAMLSDLELKFTEVYEFSGALSPPVSGYKQLTRADCSVGVVRQGEQLRIDLKEDRKFSGSEAMTKLHRQRLFDGQTTRAISGRIGNVIDGKRVDRADFHPHMMFLYNFDYGVPLSVYMKGKSEIEGFAESKWNPERDVRVQVMGEEEIDGELCSVVQIDEFSTKNQLATIGCKIWLCRSRSYLPLKSESYTYRISADIPVAEGRVSELAELEPGLWFPKI